MMPDSIMDYLGQFFGALPQQVAQPTPGFGSVLGPPSPGQTAPTTAPAHMGLMDVLGSPGAQGLLNAYFQLLSTPRSAGWTRGLGAAGAAGLQGFEQAREQQMKLPMQQLAMQKAQVEIPEIKARTQKDIQETSMFAGMTPQQQIAARYPGLAASQQANIANKMTTDSLRAEIMADKTITPDQRKIRLSVLPTIENYPTAISPTDARQMVYGKEYEPKPFAGPSGETKWFRPGEPIPSGYHEAGKPKVVPYVKVDEKGNIVPGSELRLSEDEPKPSGYESLEEYKARTTGVAGRKVTHWVQRDSKGNIINETTLPAGAPKPAGEGWLSLDVARESRITESGREHTREFDIREKGAEAGRAEKVREFDVKQGEWKPGAGGVVRNLPDGTIITVPVDKGGIGAWFSSKLGTTAPAQVVKPDGSVETMNPDQLKNYLGPIQQAMSELPGGWRIDRINPDGSVHAIDDKGNGQNFKP